MYTRIFLVVGILALMSLFGMPRVAAENINVTATVPPQPANSSTAPVMAGPVTQAPAAAPLPLLQAVAKEFAGPTTRDWVWFLLGCFVTSILWLLLAFLRRLNRSEILSAKRATV